MPLSLNLAVPAILPAIADLGNSQPSNAVAATPAIHQSATKLTPAQGHQLTMDLRHITTLRRGTEGTCVDQKGSFMAAVAAGPVHRLLGKKDLGASESPPVEAALIDGEPAWRRHSGGHTTGHNWPTFLKWADRYIKNSSEAAQRTPQ